MLEALPQLESEFEELLVRYIRNVAVANAPMMADIDVHRQFEGDRSMMEREDSTVDETDIREISGESEVPTKTILYGTLDELLSCFDPVGRAMASGQEKMLIDLLSATTSKTGNVVDAKGKPISFELLHEVLEKMQLDFDREGRPKMPTMLVHPSMNERLRQLADDPRSSEYEQKQKEIIDKKRIEWRDREANRILVG